MTAPHLVPVVYRRVFNCYLVTEEDGLTLVDTGPSGAASAVLGAIGQLGAPLRRVVLTHAHGDHVAGLDALIAAADGDVEVIVGSREAPLLAGDFELRISEPEPPPKPRSYASPATAPTRLVDDGDRVGSLHVVATPGHTPGHLSLVDTRDHTLIAGDAVSTLGRTAVSGDLVWRWPFPALSTWNKDLARVSAHRLLDARPKRLATGHGPVLEDATARLRDAISKAG
jgi:glyoxylase-like metal-dependent hydrolase (beta-lactamase superfamily II)